MQAMQDVPPQPMGLTEHEAAARLHRDGPNQLAQRDQRGLIALAWQVFQQPMLLLLLVTACVYGLVGDVGDAATLLVSVLVVAGITVVQAYRTERVLASLKALASPRSRVVRGGQVKHIASEGLVVGDHLLIAEGDRMACDAQLMHANGLMVDESLLTGESVPVLKVPSAVLEGTEQAQQEAAQALRSDPAARHQVLAGTLVVSGDADALVFATGAKTALGKMGGTLASIKPSPSRVQLELQRVVVRVGLLAALVSMVAAVAYAVRQGNWTEGLLAGLTLAMAILPEEFAVVWTVMLALGAWRLAKLGALARQPQAIEALGTTSVLCVDKTGTLTHNRMTLAWLASSAHSVPVSDDTPIDARVVPLVQAAVLASVDNGIEPMDQALLRLARRWHLHTTNHGVLIERQGVASHRPWFSNLWRSAQGDHYTLAIKGAPEALIKLCNMDDGQQAKVADAAAKLARQGLRVLGVAQVTWPASQGLLTPPAPQWLGLLGFMDPVREDVPAAVAHCREAGMRVVMITGDAPSTAIAIARAAGLAVLDTSSKVSDISSKVSNTSPAVLGSALSAMSDDALQASVRQTSVYARVSPEHKLRIVRALQAQGEVVAMTGDGVNDASALRAADIGVAMGTRGTDVAREAAALVLVEDSFSVLVDAVRMGRRIFGNLRNAVGYLIAVHVPIVGVSLLPLVMGGAPLLLPLHVVLLELIIDPACSMVFEAEAEPQDCMRVPPRPAHVRLLSASLMLRAMVVGVVGLSLSMTTVALAQWAALDTSWQRLAALASLVFGNVLMLMWYRRGAGVRRVTHSNCAFQWLLTALAAGLALILFAAPWVPQLGLPDHPTLLWVAAALTLLALVLAGALTTSNNFLARHAQALP
jgi:P-type Ca2+ transporter type 2C